MSIKPQPVGEIPQETADVALAAFPKGNIYLALRDHLENMFIDEDFVDLFAVQGQPAESPWQLAWVTVMQFMENLTDRQAADAVRSRIDWKYLLGLPLRDPGFDFSILCEFRKRLVEGDAIERLLVRFLDISRDCGWLKERGKYRTDSTHVLAKVRVLNRIELVGTTLQNALNQIALMEPEWLQTQVTPDWFTRYGRRIEQYHLPKSKAKQDELANQIGQDGVHLLTQIYFGKTTPESIKDLPEVEILRQIWLQQYYIDDNGTKMRDTKNIPSSAKRCASPHETESRYAKKGQTKWTGYKAHLTESIDKDRPHLIVHVETAPACEHDIRRLEPIHRKLAERQLLPREHLFDSVYSDAELRFTSQKDYDVEIVSPVQGHHSWQMRTPGAFTQEMFILDKEALTMTCPAGVTTRRGKPNVSTNGDPLIRFIFPLNACQSCQFKPRCTRAKCRNIQIPPIPQWEALHDARRYQKTEAFKERYKKRAGIEGTVGQACDTFGLRHSRYRGLKKTHLQNVMTAIAINLNRIYNWLEGKPRAKTRVMPFQRLAPAS